ncbi:MAG: PQQ-like beta-propeller repeat protein [Fimbriimonadia bacterium]
MRGVVFLLLPLCAHAQLDPNSPWPKWAHDNRNSGIGVKSQASGYTQDRIRWIFGDDPAEHERWLLGETVESGIVVGSDNLVYVPTSAGRVFCLNGSDGTHRWTFDTGKGVVTGTPALVLRVFNQQEDSVGGDLDGPPVAPYMVVFGCGDTVYAIRDVPGPTPTFEVLWQRQFTGFWLEQTCPAVTASGRMYFPLHSGNPQVPSRLAAVNSDGTVAWQLERDQYWGLDHSTPALAAGGALYLAARPAVGGTNGRLYKIRDLGTQGEIVWRYDPDFDPGNEDNWSKLFSSPCIGPDGTVYVGTKDYTGGPGNQSGTLWAVREDQYGQPYDYWHVAATATHYLGPVEGSPVVDPAGYVYVGTNAKMQGGQDVQNGIFLKASGPPGSAQTLFVADDSVNQETPNTDATPCIAVDAQGNFLALFQSEENGYLHKFVLDQGQLVQEWRENIRRTDLISVAMMRDGTILVGTRQVPVREGDPPPLERHGYVIAVWGFDQ